MSSTFRKMQADWSFIPIQSFLKNSIFYTLCELVCYSMVKKRAIISCLFALDPRETVFNIPKTKTCFYL